MRPSSAKYDSDPCIAEVYDSGETETEDVDLLLRLIGDRNGLKVFEPFCGTGRLAIPLAARGHTVIGLDAAAGMLNRFRAKLASLPEAVGARVTFLHGSVFETPWPTGMDLVILGGNCFYEFGSDDEQRFCIESAAASLVPGGHVFIDNDDHPSATLAPSWQRPPGTKRRSFPSGACADGTRIDATMEVASFDIAARTISYRRRAVVTRPDGRVEEHAWQETCHPAYAPDIEMWLANAGFAIDSRFGDKSGSPYQPGSPRALFWARMSK